MNHTGDGALEVQQRHHFQVAMELSEVRKDPEKDQGQQSSTFLFIKHER